MKIINHFNLRVTTPEPSLGNKKEPKSLLKNTIVIYLGVVLGVLGKYIFTLYTPEQKFALSLVDPFWLVLSLIIAAVIFPYIYKQAGLNIEKLEPVQFFIAVQNGFFWQTILEIIGKNLES